MKFIKYIIALAFLLPTTSFGAVTFPINGGTGTSTIPTLGQILVGQSNGTYAPQATSTLGTFSQWLNGVSSSIYYLLGNVGVGSSTPSSKLTVTGASGSTDNIFSVSTSSASVAKYFNITSAGSVGIGSSTPTGAKVVIKGNANSTGNTFMTTGSTDTGRFVIQDNGRVGIATTTPDQSLSVIGSVRVSSQILGPVSSLGNLIQLGTSFNITAGTGRDLRISGGADIFFENSAFGSQLRLGADAVEINGAGTPIVLSSSLVGIGTSTPTGYLSIQPGNPGIDTFNIASTTGAFVFRITDTEVISALPIRLKGYTVATLPAGVQGDTAFVTDALLPAFLGTVAGGGAVVTTVFYNGTNWVVQ